MLAVPSSLRCCAEVRCGRKHPADAVITIFLFARSSRDDPIAMTLKGTLGAVIAIFPKTNFEILETLPNTLFSLRFHEIHACDRVIVSHLESEMWFQLPRVHDSVGLVFVVVGSNVAST